MSPEETGMDLVIPVDIHHPLRRNYYSSMACGAVAIGDVDLDGRPDVFATSGAGKNALYLQKEDMRFENLAADLGLDGGEKWGVHAALIDLENDGDLDLYICNYDTPNELYLNRLIDGGKRTGILRFDEVAAERGVDVVDGSVVAAFTDYDRDGFLDFYLLTHQVYRDGGRPAEPIRLVEENGKIQVSEEWRRWYRVEEDKKGNQGEYLYTEAPRPDYLFRNRGDGHFTETTASAGITSDPHWGNSATWWDYNNDGWPDLYVGNDFKSPDLFYRNNGDGTFTEVSEGLFRHTSWNSMGAAQADFENHGRFDFIIADMLPRNHYMQKASMGSMAQRRRELSNVEGVNQIMRNAFHINTGTDRFLEGAWMAGVAHTDWTWAIRAGDFDCDGRVDLYFTNGVPGQFNHLDLPKIDHEHLIGKHHFDHFIHTPKRREQNFAFRNLGGYHFDDVSHSWGLDHVGMSYGASMGDLDGDGRLDLLVSNLEDPLSVYRNVGETGNRIVVQLEGRASNRHGIGARVSVRTPDGVVRSRQFFPVGGYLDADEPLIHVGLGDAERISEMTIAWPGGATQVFRDLPVNFRHVVTEPEEEREKSPALLSMAPEKTRFRRSEALKSHPHVDVEYDDFARQPLMTFKLSQLGPGQAWGDIDGDGVADLFLGGAGSQPGKLFLNRTKKGAGAEEVQLEALKIPVLEEDAYFEDMGAAFFDADEDGHLDLYVTSGSVECEPGEEVLRDRLYLNRGKDGFVRAPEGMLPDIRESSGVVAAGDLDRDGTLELFIGSRSIPGDYPATPRSVLLRKEGSRYLAVEDEMAPGLGHCGLVTGAVWADFDNDGWQDLLVATDWGPIRLFRNREGRLEEVTENAGLSGEGLEMLGWWTGVDAGDVNGDGILDFVASNLGRNTLYQPSLLFPEMLFYNDFDDSGYRNIVEAYFAEEKGTKRAYPRATFHDAFLAMPFVADRLQNYHTYASTDLTGIYPFRKLKSALTLQANCMDSSVFLNDGKGRFTRHPLPRMAQISPGFGIVLRDLDLDGRLDVVISHNHLQPMEEIGEMAMGLGQVLLNTGGSGEELFRPERLAESGFEVTGDAKSLGVSDLNQDGRPDLLVGVNNDEPSLFINEGAAESEGESLLVRLAGPPGNPSGIGTRLELRVEGWPLQIREITGGGSYLTQCDPMPSFALPKGRGGELSVRWPGGKEETRSIPADEPGPIEIKAPSRAPQP
ncbi:MAG: VCBS repeat-containing protein [Verrucomicrobiae bacterium]|nr:VCBS repeat-containing protein [Verrucomicrobiae bacterium]